MKQRFREQVYASIQREGYEMLPPEQRAEFIATQHPVLKRRVSVSKAQKKAFGQFYWCYQLDNGWSAFPSKSQNETVEKYRAFKELKDEQA